MLNTLVAGQYSYATYANGRWQHRFINPMNLWWQGDQKSIALAQMANNIRLFPYLVQLIIRLVPSLQGGAILFSSAVRQCNDKLAF